MRRYARAATESDRMTLYEYFNTPESVLPQEVIYGVHRVADAPFVPHQAALADFFRALDDHVREKGCGDIWLSAIDVILDPDRERPLIVQPDLLFISNDRREIVRERIWGAPDMVLEILSPNPRIGKLEERIGWCARYGVREAWLWHQIDRELTILLLDREGVAERRVFDRHEPIQSSVLPDFNRSVSSFLRLIV